MSIANVLVVGSMTLSVAACGGPGSGNPSTAPNASGCASLRTELSKYEKKGVASWAEAKNAGKKLSKAKEADLRIYNDLLNQYLGGRCHT
ncbi:MAG: hypothetical protein K0U34_05705 [Alphaproteobacteria bacterium]|nr:hypothetical protein [Alphaproteobacteria bacterium]